MTDEKITTPPPKPSGGPQRLRIGFNVLVQIVLILFLAIMVNYLGFEHYKRWDLSRDKKYTLSDKSKRFLDSIKGTVRLTVFFDPNVAIAQDVQNLLTEYQYAAKGKIDVENIDPVRSLSRAKEVFDKYKVVTDDSLVIVDYEGRSKTVKAAEMAEMDAGNPMFGEPAKVTAFKGEQALTSAMIDVVEGRKNTVGYVLGHKEPPIAKAADSISPTLTPQEGAASPISVLRMFIENENVQLTELNLLEVPAVPADLKAVMIVAPQYDFSEREMKTLRDYWDKQGRILLLLDPTADTPRLRAFLTDLGVRVNEDRLMANVQTGIQEVARVRDVVAFFLPDSPITKRLAEVRAPFLGATASLTIAKSATEAASNVQIKPLAQAMKGYWGELDYNSNDETALQFTPGRDHEEPLVLAVSIEKGGSADERVQANSSRLVLVSNGSFVDDSGLSQGQQGLDFVSGAVNWLLNREQLIGIAPKVPQTLTFTLDDRSLKNLRWLFLVIIPLVPAVLGVAVWWKRRA